MNLNMGDLMGQFQQMQQKMQELKARMNEITVEAETGGGMVKVTATANKRVLRVSIDPTILDDREMVEDLVAAATNRALENAEAKGQEAMAELTKGLFPGGMPPGFNPAQFGL